MTVPETQPEEVKASGAVRSPKHSSCRHFSPTAYSTPAACAAQEDSRRAGAAPHQSSGGSMALAEDVARWTWHKGRFEEISGSAQMAALLHPGPRASRSPFSSPSTCRQMWTPPQPGRATPMRSGRTASSTSAMRRCASTMRGKACRGCCGSSTSTTHPPPSCFAGLPRSGTRSWRMRFWRPATRSACTAIVTSSCAPWTRTRNSRN